MDAHNLSLCFCPTLVGSNVLQDVQMCSIPGGPSLFPLQKPTTPQSSDAGGRQATLGMVVKICIERYFEIFEEIVDRSEPLYSPGAGVLSNGLDAADGGMGSPRRDGHDDEESLDDAMLVMPLGPTPPSSNMPSPYANGGTPRSPPTAWRHKHRRMGSSGSAVSAAQTTPSVADSSNSKRRDSIGGTLGKSRSRRSIVSIEKSMKDGGRGTITIGKSTARRPGGAGVEAVSVTALGFFMPPSEESVPALKSSQTVSDEDSKSVDDTASSTSAKSTRSRATGQQLSEVAE